MLLICTLIIVVVSSVELFQQRKAQQTLILREFDSFEQGAKQTIREAVWQCDWDMVKTIVESQTSQLLSYVEVCDDKKLECLEYGQQGKKPYLELHSVIRYQEVGRDASVEIGSILLQGHYETIYSFLWHDMPLLLLTNSFSVFGVAIILFWLFHRQVVRRLLVIEKYTHGIDLQHIEKIQSLEAETVERNLDEIDLLADAVGGLVDKIKDEFERRKVLERQLTQAQKMEALGTLAGGIAHDFNNILAAILGFAELSYLSSEPGSPVHNNLQKIISAGQRAKNLIAQILVFSRRTEVPQEVLRFADVIEEALTLIRAFLPAGIKIVVELDETICIKGDSTQLHQIIMNLASNAGHVLSESGGRLSITLRRIELDGPQAELLVLNTGKYACLEIMDDGPGISEEIQERVFEPFFTTKKAGKGTGMGLAVVHGIVRSHEGAIKLTSRPGEGTLFTIYLPETEIKTITDQSFSHMPKGAGEHVVLVDDEAPVLEMGKAVLESLGYNVVAFDNPENALQFFGEKNCTELLITDLAMPEINGVELARAFRELHPSVPVMLWTGYKDEEAAGAFDRNVITHILQKPFEMEKLAQNVYRILNHQPVED